MPQSVKVVVTEFMDLSALEAFGADVSVEYNPGLVDDRPGLLGLLSDCDALIVRNRTQVDQEILDAAPKLRVVGRLGVGLDNIDMPACAARNVEVCPATGANTLSVAEYVIATTLILTRGAFFSNVAMLAGEWPRGTLGTGGEVSGRCMGLYGFGGIAQAVAERARALGMRIAAFDPYVPEDAAVWQGVQRCDAAQLLATADVLSLHVPLTDETRNMINVEAIASMKPGAVLINTARGSIIDQPALAEALKSGALGGAAIDVFPSEPLTAEAAAHFQDTPNLILTPHVAGVTDEGNGRVSTVTVANVKEVLGL